MILEPHLQADRKLVSKFDLPETKSRLLVKSTWNKKMNV